MNKKFSNKLAIACIFASKRNCLAFDIVELRKILHVTFQLLRHLLAKPWMLYSFVFLILLILSNPIFAHGLASDRIHDINHAIEQQPDNAVYFLKRGRIYYEEQNWKNAQADYEQALTLDGSLHEAHYWLGVLFLAQHKLAFSEMQLKSYLKEKPKSAAGYEALADIYRIRERYLKAADFYHLAIEMNENPSPDLYLQRMNSLLKIQPLPKTTIVAELNEAIDQHGPIPTFIELLIETNQQAGDYSTALTELEKMPKALRQSPLWQLRKGELLMLSGRKQQAIEVYQNLLVTIGKLPLYQQQRKAVLEAGEQAKTAISLLQKG